MNKQCRRIVAGWMMYTAFLALGAFTSLAALPEPSAAEAGPGVQTAENGQPLAITDTVQPSSAAETGQLPPAAETGQLSSAAETAGPLSALTAAEPEGEVVLDPKFQWTDEAQTKFSIYWTITNGSNMTIPETEAEFILPGGKGLSFSGTAGSSRSEPGNYSLTVGNTDPAVTVLNISSFVSGERFSFYAEGIRDPETEAGEIGILDIRLTLRGSEESGLVHATSERVYIPKVEPQAETGVPEPEPVSVTRLHSFSVLNVNLAGSGKQPVQAELVPGTAGIDQVRLKNIWENGKYRMGFYASEEVIPNDGAGLGKRLIDMLWPVVLIIFVTMLTDRLLQMFLVRRKERQKKFDPRRNLTKFEAYK